MKYKVKGIEVDTPNLEDYYGLDLSDELGKKLSEEISKQIDTEILKSLGIKTRNMRRVDKIKRILDNRGAL